jgi:hypothetical protein
VSAVPGGPNKSVRAVLDCRVAAPRWSTGRTRRRDRGWWYRDTARDLIGLGGRLVLVGLHDRQFETDAKHLTLSEIEVIGTNAHVCDADLPGPWSCWQFETLIDPWAAEIRPIAMV